MTKSDLVRLLSQQWPDFQRPVIEKAISLFFAEIVKSLAANHRVELRGFGAFSPRVRKPRRARNPRTGEAVHVAEKRVPFFKASKDLIPIPHSPAPLRLRSGQLEERKK